MIIENFVALFYAIGHDNKTKTIWTTKINRTFQYCNTCTYLFDD